MLLFAIAAVGGFLIVVAIAAAAAPLTPILGPATAALYSSGSLSVYAGAHIVTALLHLYALLRKPKLRRFVLTVEQILTLFIVVLLLLLSGFTSPLFIYALFMGLVANTLRDNANLF